GLGLLALVLRDLLLGDVPLGFGTARGFNEYRARITGLDAFWLQVPDLLAGLGLPDEPGMHRWRPAAERALSSLAAVTDAADSAGGGTMARRLEAWVEKLHGKIAGRGTPAAPASVQEELR
ncbi:MAG: hypothetical protein ACRD2T_06690, partial [Thermoanaerobaculia bacterium]